MRYDYPQYMDEQPDGTSYPSTCLWADLPHDAMVVDDVDKDTTSVRDFNRDTGANECKRLGLVPDSLFTLEFGDPAAKIDLQSGRQRLRRPLLVHPHAFGPESSGSPRRGSSATSCAAGPGCWCTFRRITPASFRPMSSVTPRTSTRRNWCRQARNGGPS